MARTLRAASAVVGPALALLSVVHLGVDEFSLVTPSGQVWLHVGRGKLATIASDEPGPRRVRWQQHWNPFESNAPDIYFGPRTADFELLGLQYVAGTRYRTPFTGWAVGVSYWYGVALAVLVFWASHRRVRRVRAAGSAASERGPEAADYEERAGGSGAAEPDVAPERRPASG